MHCKDPKLTQSECAICKYPASLEFHSPDGQIYSNEHVGLRITDQDELIVHCIGSCRDNGSVSPHATIGVWFQEGSSYNVAEFLPEALPKSKEASELWAAFRAIEEGSKRLLELQPRQALGSNRRERTLVIATDSNSVYSGMTTLIVKWRDNKYRNAKGKTVNNTALYLMLDEAVHSLREKSHILVRFWLRPKRSNKGADQLANEAYNTQPIRSTGNTFGEIFETMDRKVLEFLGATVQRLVDEYFEVDACSRRPPPSYRNLIYHQQSAVRKIQRSMFPFALFAPFLYMFLPELITPFPCFCCVIAASIHSRWITIPGLTPTELEAIKSPVARQGTSTFADSVLGQIWRLTTLHYGS
ncbi:hypothetical protein BDZ91DRAFT_729540 [Kalaharituber pfeilii]|nr:hypothetical protein BDZ91DRAFT_729540 [Kalaharituber pfeilii]